MIQWCLMALLDLLMHTNQRLFCSVNQKIQPTNQSPKQNYEDFEKNLGVGLICEIPYLYASEYYSASSQNRLYIKYLLSIFWNLWCGHPFPVLVLWPQGHKTHRPQDTQVKEIKCEEWRNLFYFTKLPENVGELCNFLHPVFSSIEYGCEWTPGGPYLVVKNNPRFKEIKNGDGDLWFVHTEINQCYSEIPIRPNAWLW